VKPEEWEAIPEIGDYSIKRRKTFESFVPVPDTLLSKVCSASQN
jgi:pre-mRNA-processing factor 6